MTHPSSFDPSKQTLSSDIIAARVVGLDLSELGDKRPVHVFEKLFGSARRKWASAANSGESPEVVSKLCASMDYADKALKKFTETELELWNISIDILDGTPHAFLRFDEAAFASHKGVFFYIDGLYHWAKSKGVIVPEWDLGGADATQPAWVKSEGDALRFKPKEASDSAPAHTHRSDASKADRHHQEVETDLHTKSSADVWNGVTIDFRAHNKIFIKFPDGKSKTVDAEKTGLINKRTKNLNTAGTALLGLATKPSIRKKRKKSGAGIIGKVMTELRNSLKALTLYDSDPFYPHNKADEWKPRFRVQDRRRAGDERAEEKAIHISFDDTRVPSGNLLDMD
jgi:hypothetical protein